MNHVKFTSSLWDIELYSLLSLVFQTQSQSVSSSSPLTMGESLCGWRWRMSGWSCGGLGGFLTPGPKEDWFLIQNQLLIHIHLASEKMVEDDDLLGSSDTLHKCCHLLEVDRLELVLIEEVLSVHPGWRVKHLETVMIQSQVTVSSISEVWWLQAQCRGRAPLCCSPCICPSHVNVFLWWTQMVSVQFQNCNIQYLFQCPFQVTFWWRMEMYLQITWQIPCKLQM